MGASRFNPLSPAFRGKYPDEILTTGVLVYDKPSAAWKSAHPKWEERAGSYFDAETDEKCGPDDVEVTLMLTIERVEPSQLNPGEPGKWPTSKVIPLGPLIFMQRDPRGELQAVPAMMTLSDFRRLTPIEGQVRKDDNPAPPGEELLLQDAAAEEAFADRKPDEGGN